MQATIGRDVHASLSCATRLSPHHALLQLPGTDVTLHAYQCMRAARFSFFIHPSTEGVCFESNSNHIESSDLFLRNNWIHNAEFVLTKNPLLTINSPYILSRSTLLNAQFSNHISTGTNFHCSYHHICVYLNKV